MLENNLELLHSTAIIEKLLESHVDVNKSTAARRVLPQSIEAFSTNADPSLYPETTASQERLAPVDHSKELIKSFRNHDFIGDKIMNTFKNLVKTQSSYSVISTDSIDGQERKSARYGHKSRKSKKSVAGHS